MDKNAIKKYAVWARRELISRVSQKALQYGITEDSMEPASATSVNGVVLTGSEIKQRKALIEKVEKEGYQQVMEEVAYTWFNRFPPYGLWRSTDTCQAMCVYLQMMRTILSRRFLRKLSIWNWTDWIWKRSMH